MDVTLTTAMPAAQTLSDAKAAYLDAFAEPPYGENPEMALAFAERVERYAAERDGFRLVTARDASGAMCAIGLAVLARPGDWWRDQIAAAIPAVQGDEWLGALCLEVVHLAVVPRARARGIGRVVHDVLIAGRPAPTAMLTVHPAATPAQRLYKSRGWTMVTDRLPTGGPDYWLMGKRL
jgi:GNAT superfamily N-acetyltransferase